MAGATIPVAAWSQPQRLTSADAIAFGSAVSAAGAHVVVGAPREQAGAGAAYAYTYDAAAGWTLTARFGGAQHEALGTSVALHDGFLVIGAPDGGTMGGGTVYIYKYVAGAWLPVDTLEAPTPGQNDDFGTAVAMRGIFVFVGAPGQYVQTPGGGAVHVFVRMPNDRWERRQEIPAPDGGRFGSSIALESENAIVGAPQADGQRGRAAGKAYILQRTGGSDWAQHTTLVAGNESENSHFGAAVSIDADDQTGASTAFVGAPAAGAAKAGAAYVYGLAAGTWTQKVRYEPASRFFNDRIGQAVLFKEGSFLVGMPGRSANAGAMVSLSIDTTSYVWREHAWHDAPQGQGAGSFGFAMAMSQDYVLVGAPEEAKTDSTSGAVYVYRRSVALARHGEGMQSADGLVAYPNPFRDAVTITFGAADTPVPLLGIYDVLGRRVAVLRSGGTVGHVIVWRPGPGLPDGHYAVVAHGGVTRATRLLTRLR